MRRVEEVEQEKEHQETVWWRAHQSDGRHLSSLGFHINADRFSIVCFSIVLFSIVLRCTLLYLSNSVFPVEQAYFLSVSLSRLSYRLCVLLSVHCPLTRCPLSYCALLYFRHVYVYPFGISLSGNRSYFSSLVQSFSQSLKQSSAFVCLLVSCIVFSSAHPYISLMQQPVLSSSLSIYNLCPAVLFARSFVISPLFCFFSVR